ncbi:MAG: aliphatic sulfonate ABC transporter substrate-binding protein [Spiribacter salinus]|uniref:Aliphatic sulfonate ABC transporter substrate-binding protein n=1 Tax=Spiribacter salinus TaxID=1335746 RepID=A0A540V5R8_9GAMM|nr:MAG: aliphatic sulfonate ABC transporter substrate-binding protein [Spiribacter salinus]
MRNATLILALALLFSAFSASAEPLRIGYNQWAGFGPVFVAKEKGFFADEGLDVDMNAFGGPADTLPPLIAGSLDMALSTPDSVIPLNDNGKEVVAIMVLDASHGGDGIIAHESIDSVADLKGKRVGVTLGEVNHLLLMLALGEAGLSGDDINLTNMSAGDAGAAFLSGNLDAAVTWEPWLSRAGEGDGHVLFTSADVPNMLIDVVTVTPETLDTREDDLKAFTAAIDKALEEIESNPSESHEIIADWLDTEADQVAGMMEGIRVYGSEKNTRLFSEDDGIAHSFSEIQTFLINQGLAEEGLDAKDMLDGRLFID